MKWKHPISPSVILVLGRCHIPVVDVVGWEPTCVCRTAGDGVPRSKRISACCECHGRRLKSPAWLGKGWRKDTTAAGQVQLQAMETY